MTFKMKSVDDIDDYIAKRLALWWIAKGAAGRVLSVPIKMSDKYTDAELAQLAYDGLDVERLRIVYAGDSLSLDAAEESK